MKAPDDYPMLVYRDSDSGDWVAAVFDLPGCIGVGDSPEEAVSVARTFIGHWIESARDCGWTTRQPTAIGDYDLTVSVKTPPCKS